MEAKDTVISLGKADNDSLMMEQILLAQAEISFKAGIREVVELIGNDAFEHNDSMYGHAVEDCFACRWELKLKEWDYD